MAKKFPLNPKHPERLCWGCDKYCPAEELLCGNGSGRTEHPAELFGDDWYTWGEWSDEYAEAASNATEEGQATHLTPKSRSASSGK